VAVTLSRDLNSPLSEIRRLTLTDAAAWMDAIRRTNDRDREALPWQH
jgi:hypothetical protein